jgi:DTW domain-containing protein YfiP
MPNEDRTRQVPLAFPPRDGTWRRARKMNRGAPLRRFLKRN